MSTQISPFSPAQIHILEMMSFIKTSEALDELNDVIANYFTQRLDEEISNLWANGTLTEEKVENFRQLD